MRISIKYCEPASPDAYAVKFRSPTEWEDILHFIRDQRAVIDATLRFDISGGVPSMSFHKAGSATFILVPGDWLVFDCAKASFSVMSWNEVSAHRWASV